MVDVPVNGAVLEWARKERRLSARDAARLLQIPEEQVLRLESGDYVPSLGLLRQIATKYQIQLASLLMPEPLPPEARPDVHDFRTVGGKDAVVTTQLALAIEQVAEQAEAFADLRELEPRRYPAPDVPQYTRHDTPRDVAKRERERLGISVNEQLAWKKDRDAFLRWRTAIEARGMYVQLLNLGDTDAVRGLSFWEPRGVAIIVVNSEEENYRARVFSLLHEYGHVLLRMCGISDQNRTSRIERYCNQFAAHFLMPSDPFIQVAHGLHSEGRPWTEYHVNRLSTQFHVSKSATAIRMEEVGLVEPGFYDTLKEGWNKTPRAKGGGGGANVTPSEKRANRLGSRTVATVTGAIDSGDLSILDGYELMDVRPQDFGDLIEVIRGRQAEYGGAT